MSGASPDSYEYPYEETWPVWPESEVDRLRRLQEWQGWNVEPYAAEQSSFPNPSSSAILLEEAFEFGEEQDSEMAQRLATLAGWEKACSIEALIFGRWRDYEGVSSSFIVEALEENTSRFPALRGLFLGAIDCEALRPNAWMIRQGEVSRLLNAFPGLEHFAVRGTRGMRFQPTRHLCLRTLTFESPNLPVQVLRNLHESVLPDLEELTIHVGQRSNWQKWDDALEALLSSDSFPNLTRLGLCNAANADRVAIMLAQSPVLSRLRELDLSFGNLSDAGVQALLEAPRFRELEWFRVQHHFLSPDMEAALKSLSLRVELSDGLWLDHHAAYRNDDEEERDDDDFYESTME